MTCRTRPGATARVEVNIGNAVLSKKLAKRTAEGLQRLGVKIGRGGWVVRADHTTGARASNYRNNAGREIPVATVTVTWRLLAPDGAEVWKTTDIDAFDPNRSKYVKVGSRQFMGEHSQFEGDYGGRDPEKAQVEEILEQIVSSRAGAPGMPVRFVKTPEGITRLPLQAKLAQ